ncbi:MAG: tRNA pseudouridine(55) synthase TruB [Eubacteriales bacterium]|nr:tRNA pseudouridine(55) synthase TruB [Eubacteriales bacterium]
MDGIISVLKPPAMSSSDVVVDIRRLFEQKKVGHTGTLDPGAAGVLPICLGRATRLFDYLVDKEKQYIFEICFGWATDTQDAYGKIIYSCQREVTQEELLGVLPRFMGEQTQIAPMYSALKSGGRKLYDIALAGETVPDKVRQITVGDIHLIEQTDKNRFLLSVDCSRGTYVRTICHDIGMALDTAAHLSFLLRTKSGAFELKDSYTIAELEKMKAEGTLERAVTSCQKAMEFLPQVNIPSDRESAVKNGLTTTVKGVANGRVRCYCKGLFLGLAQVEREQLKLEVHLY